MRVHLFDIAHARSGDKGSAANVGVIARSAAAYEFLRGALTADAVARFFEPLAGGRAIRYELPNLLAFNFVLPGALAPGGSLSLRTDAQGKALAQALLEMPLDVPDDLMAR